MNSFPLLLRRLWLPLAFVAFALAGTFPHELAAAAQPTPESVAADYPRMLEAQFGSDPVSIPAGGLTLERDTATLTFTSGTLRFAEPTSDGQTTGLVFEGKGRFRMLIPDPVELRQFQRMAQDRRLELVDTLFSSAVLRTTEPGVIAKLRAQLGRKSSHAGYTQAPLAKARQENWLVQRFVDVDARVAAGLLIPNDEFLFVEMRTEKFGWLNYGFDGLDTEEVSLRHWQDEHKGSESWVQLDRPEDRRDDGRPRSERRAMIDLEHVAIQADITKASKKTQRLGFSQLKTRQGKFIVDLTFEPRVGGARALPLKFSPQAEITQILAADGTPLAFLRDHLGSRSSLLTKPFYDDDLVVLLKRPLVRGEPHRLRFVYELQTLNYMPGGSWYPGPEGAFYDPHTGAFTITSDDRFTVFAMGAEGESSVDSGQRTTTWHVEQPVRMLTFAFSDQHTQHKELEPKGLPKIVVFGTTHENRIHNIAVDTSNSLTYFNRVFGHGPQTPTLFVASIDAFHGQAFEGFIHMGDLAERAILTEEFLEAFHAHEIAHQWWGHRVAWKSYRDQWLSEAFAEYAAALFMEATRPNGPKVYNEMMATFVGSVTGVAQRTSFGMQVVERNDKERARIGPIGVGYRASTAGSARGYFGASYQKGAVVLHMLRTMLRNMTKNDDVFFNVLRRFIDTYAGRAASTQDFIDTLTAVAPADWEWFFDQWINGTDVPTYVWASEPATLDGKPAIKLTVRQENVDRGFRMPVPVRLEFGKKEVGQVVVLVDEPEETFTIPVPKAPKRIELNPDHAVLAVVKNR